MPASWLPWIRIQECKIEFLRQPGRQAGRQADRWTDEIGSSNASIMRDHIFKHRLTRALYAFSSCRSASARPMSQHRRGRAWFMGSLHCASNANLIANGSIANPYKTGDFWETKGCSVGRTCKAASFVHSRTRGIREFETFYGLWGRTGYGIAICAMCRCRLDPRLLHTSPRRWRRIAKHTPRVVFAKRPINGPIVCYRLPVSNAANAPLSETAHRACGWVSFRASPDMVSVSTPSAALPLARERAGDIFSMAVMPLLLWMCSYKAMQISAERAWLCFRCAVFARNLTANDTSGTTRASPRFFSIDFVRAWACFDSVVLLRYSRIVWRTEANCSRGHAVVPADMSLLHCSR
ncbi:hypothetical protein CYME_CMA060C [Cyanidioschyzon merolae strain 10D]|uniref:Uncharacterized protein n=1 Tax=Cyanidioschyzon merolae (strain NIES-3377 / 10D) TaxID=280699 RepID=M1V3J3_CYAM1|nr:hypothetical protein CYME_CMA060C [Cyanidioschyzon merolae strain 10D]BAM78770.1 hypothetical protein CYME_CMA060C [Cyanidioschyzon merolae strain 10D]|eukprot:XP_005535056.1 hypothetical protein CYME_CMA060C [Cyanidioschyzon merolae strain 10D]